MPKNEPQLRAAAAFVDGTQTIAERLSASYQEEPEPGPWFPRASGCGGCLREMAHLAAGLTARPASPESLRTFELGHQRGAELARRAKAIWPDAECELEVSIPLPNSPHVMLGHLDLWIPSLRTIIDFKTAGGFKMGLLAQGKVGAGEDYEMQLQAYRHGVLHRAWEFSLISSPGETYHGIYDARSIRCLLIFEAKDSDARNGVTAGMLHEVEVPHTAELEARFQQRMSALAAILRDRDAGTLDPTSAPGVWGTKGDWRCKQDRTTGRPLYCKVGPEVGKCKTRAND